MKIIKRIQFFAIYWIIGIIFLFPSISSATIVEYKFIGVVTNLVSSISNEFSTGELIEGSFKVDSTNKTNQSTRTIFSASDLLVSIGDDYNLIANTGSVIIRNESDPIGDGFSVVFDSFSGISGLPVNGLSPGYFDIQLDWLFNNGPLISQNLPDMVPLFPNPIDRSNINFPADSNRLSFEVQSVSVVPIPAALWLFASALGFLGYMNRDKLS